MLSHGVHAAPKNLRGRGKRRMDAATNLLRKAFYSCTLYIWLLGALLPDPTGAPPLDPTSIPRHPVPTLTLEPSYATG